MKFSKLYHSIVQLFKKWIDLICKNIFLPHENHINIMKNIVYKQKQ